MRILGTIQRCALGLLCLVADVVLAQGGAVPEPPTNLVPRLTPSPVELFRMLLATNAGGREAWLAAKPPASRANIEAKLREYEAMLPEQRDQKLRASQLSWYLPPLMKMPATNRAAVLAVIPEEDRKVVEMRLGQLIILPPPILNQLITNQSLLRMFDAGPMSGSNVLTQVSADQRRLAEQVYPVWKRLLELPPSDRAKPLAKLTSADRANMEMALNKIGKLSPEERAQAYAGFKKFAELSASEREAFLNSAQRWRAMSEREREVWRNMTAILQRPASGVPIPPLPPMPRRATSTLLTTND